MTPADLPRVGQRWHLSTSDWLWADRIGECQHAASGARGSRDGGADVHIRIAGCAGEIAVARIMGIEPQIRCDPDGPERDRPDIETTLGTLIDVKTGHPLTWCETTRPDWWYVVGSLSGLHFGITHVQYGRAILRAAKHPPTWMCPRRGTALLNWLIE